MRPGYFPERQAVPDAMIDLYKAALERQDIFGEIEGQIAKTMEVIYAILESRGMDWKDVCRLIAYFKDAANLGLFPQYCEAQGISELPVAYVKDDICRDDLLFEVELDAIVAK